MAKFRLSPLEINPDYEPRDSHKAPQPTGQVFDNFISRLGQMLSEGIIHVNACFAKETMNRRGVCLAHGSAMLGEALSGSMRFDLMALMRLQAGMKR